LGQRVGAQTEKQGKAREEAIFTFIGGHKITFGGHKITIFTKIVLWLPKNI
jgi:hypothetical protein